MYSVVLTLRYCVTKLLCDQSNESHQAALHFHVVLFLSSKTFSNLHPLVFKKVNVQGKKQSHTWIARLTVSGFFVLIGAVLNTYWSLMDKGIPCNFLATN